MHREHDCLPPSLFGNEIENTREHVRLVGVGRTMYRGDTILPSLELQPIENIGSSFGDRRSKQRCVVHEIAYQMHILHEPFTPEILDGIRGYAKQQRA